ncbi:hypothetical protein [Rhodococcoides fascians]|nr:hypothetical protein [Rhodococcus fascians]MDQ0281747.1 hypothetical protein [Rhodococcus fascians]
MSAPVIDRPRTSATWTIPSSRRPGETWYAPGEKFVVIDGVRRPVVCEA